MAYIYLISNDINNKVYVGKTLTTISERYSKHIWDAKNSKDNCAIHHAMRKYGLEHFKIIELEKCSNDELSDKEQYWIKYYDSYNNGYNLTPGGDGNPKYDYTAIYQEFMSGKTQKEVAEKFGCEKHTITRVLRSFDVPIQEMQKGKFNNSQKGVLQIDINTHKILNQFPSLTKAAEHEGCSIAMMSMVCNGKRKLVNKNYTYTKEVKQC